MKIKDIKEMMQQKAKYTRQDMAVINNTLKFVNSTSAKGRDKFDHNLIGDAIASSNPRLKDFCDFTSDLADWEELNIDARNIAEQSTKLMMLRNYAKLMANEEYNFTRATYKIMLEEAIGWSTKYPKESNEYFYLVTGARYLLLALSP